jgi:hypothetical protein
MYKITTECKQAIFKLISNKPFNAVFGITKLMEKSDVTEEEANAIINALGQFPYSEVHEFFAKIQEYFLESQPELNSDCEEMAKAEVESPTHEETCKEK